MKAKQWIGVCAVVMSVAGSLSRVSAQVTSDVWQAQMVLNGMLKTATPPPYFTKKVVTSSVLVNLALANAPGATVPSNQVLAWVNPGGAAHRLVVFDTTSGTVLAEIGTFDGNDFKTSPTQKQFTELLSIENVGSPTNGLNGGSLMCVGSRKQTLDGDFNQVTSTVSGWVDVTVTDTISGTPLQGTVVIPKGTFVTTKRIGTLVEPAPVISLSTNTLSATATAGGPDPAPQAFSVCNNGPAGSVLNYTVTLQGQTPSPASVVISPSSGTLVSGQCQSHTVSISLNGTPAGTYTGTLTISDPDAANDPQTIEGTLTVNP